MKPYLTLLALFFTLFATAQDNTPKREIFGANRIGFYLSLGTGYNTLNKKGLFLTQYSTIGFTFKNRFSIEYSHCFAYRTVKEIGHIIAGDSSYTVIPPQSQPYTAYTTKFEAYDANAEGLYSISMLNAYIYLYRGYRWGVSSRITAWTNKIALLRFYIIGKNVNSGIVQYKPEKPVTEADPRSGYITNYGNIGISLDYHLNSVFNLKLDVIPYAFSYDNTFSLGQHIYTKKGDDKQFLSYISNTSQFNIHISYYFITLSKKNKNL